jgi:flagellar hook assembly protein FlgD
MWRARNPPDAILAYYLKAAAPGPVKVQIADLDGTVIREIDGATQPGIHRVAWDLKATGGARVGPGTYTVRLVANGRTTSASIDVTADPNR